MDINVTNKNIKKEMVILIPVIIAVIILGIFCIMGIYKVDIHILSTIQSIRGDMLTTFMKTFTNMCSPIALFFITLGTCVFVKNKKIGLLMGANLGIVVLLNQIFKFIFARQRPHDFMIIEETGYSFPSGHSMVSMAFYGFIIYVIWKYEKVKWLRNTLVALFALLILLIGFSRVYLGVHYPSDVIAGLTIGYVSLILLVSSKYEKM